MPVTVCILGSGNWGSAISRLVGVNTQRLPGTFNKQVKMWVYDEILEDGRMLASVINTDHVNVKYLKDFSLPENIVAVTDIGDAVCDADYLIFVLPHQFVLDYLSDIKNNLKKGAKAISLIKGFSIPPEGGLVPVSKSIGDDLGIPVSVLMGANIACQVAAEEFCETTIGCTDQQDSAIYKDMFQTPNFRVVVVSDIITVEACGALKNIVAVGAGIVDGLKLGDNTKAAVIRLGLMEMIKFVKILHPDSKRDTFFESCGVADLVTTCYGGRNRLIAEQFICRHGVSLEELEKELLDGQKLQGPETAREVYKMLEDMGILKEFPLFSAVHLICIGKMCANVGFLDALRSHPEHE